MSRQITPKVVITVAEPMVNKIQSAADVDARAPWRCNPRHVRIAALASAAATGRPTANTTAATPDPIFDAIARHRVYAAAATWAAIALELDDLQLDKAYDAENGARDGLLRVMPTSIAGVCALLRYTAEFVYSARTWGNGLAPQGPAAPSVHDEGVDWEIPLISHVARALEAIQGSQYV